MNFKPIFDNVLIKVIEEENKSAGGIIIPDSAKEKSFKGEIVSLGNGKILDNGNVLPMAVKVGDKVAFAKYSGMEVKLDGEAYMLVKESEILGIFN